MATPTHPHRSGWLRRLWLGFWLRLWAPRAPHPATPVAPPTPGAPPRRAQAAPWHGLGRAMRQLQANRANKRAKVLLGPCAPTPGVVPTQDLNRVTQLAKDSMPFGWVNGTGSFANGGFDNYFKGYPYLAQLSQMPEYRNISQTIAEEMTRKGITIKGSDTVNKKKIAELQEFVNKYKLMEVCCKALEQDGFFGRAHIYVDITTPSGNKVYDDPVELESELFLSPKKIKKGCPLVFTVVEAMWSYPGLYNSTNPLDENYYKPETWYVMGKTVHASRLIPIISQPVADILKAAYSFGGLSLSQIAEPYVDNWIRTRNSVGDMVHSYSLTGLKTDLSTLLESQAGDDDPSNVLNRVALLNETKDNRSTVVIDKESEEFFQYNTPIAGLDKLQAQAQEHICSVTHIPLVKYTGLSPTGLNASSDGEIRVWYDFILARNERVLRQPLKYMLEIIQLVEWGKIDESLGFDFTPLYEPTSKEVEELRKSRAETDKVYVDSGVISQQDARNVVVNEPGSRYASLDQALPPELLDDDEEAEVALVSKSGRSGNEE